MAVSSPTAEQAASSMLVDKTISKQEYELIKAVNQRDARLRSDVQNEVLAKLLEEIEQLRSIRSSVKEAYSTHQLDGQNPGSINEVCTCCAQRLSLWSLRGAGEPCVKCGEITCENCQRELFQHYRQHHAKTTSVETTTDTGSIWQSLFGNLFEPNAWLCRYCFKLLQAVVIEYQFGTPEINPGISNCLTQAVRGRHNNVTDQTDGSYNYQSPAEKNSNAFAGLTQAERNHLRDVMTRDQEFRTAIRSDLVTTLEFEVRTLLRQSDLARQLSASSMTSPTSSKSSGAMVKSPAAGNNAQTTCLRCLRVLSRFNSAGAGRPCPVCTERVCLHCQIHVPKMPLIVSNRDTSAALFPNDQSATKKRRTSWFDKFSLLKLNDDDAKHSSAWLCTCCYKMLQIRLLEKQFSDNLTLPMPAVGNKVDQDAQAVAVSKSLPTSKSMANLKNFQQPAAVALVSNKSTENQNFTTSTVAHLTLPANVKKIQHHHHQFARPHLFSAKSSPALVSGTISSSESSLDGELSGTEQREMFSGNDKGYIHESSTFKVHLFGKKKGSKKLAGQVGQLSVKREDALRFHNNNRRQSLQPDHSSSHHSREAPSATFQTSMFDVHANNLNEGSSDNVNTLASSAQTTVTFSADTVFNRVPKIVISELNASGVLTENIDVPSTITDGNCAYEKAAVNSGKIVASSGAFEREASTGSQSAQPPSGKNVRGARPYKPARLVSGSSTDDEYFVSPPSSPTITEPGKIDLSSMFITSPAVSVYGTPNNSDTEQGEKSEKKNGGGADAKVKWQSALMLAANVEQNNSGAESGTKLAKKNADETVRPSNSAALHTVAKSQPVKFYTPHDANIETVRSDVSSEAVNQKNNNSNLVLPGSISRRKPDNLTTSAAVVEKNLTQPLKQKAELPPLPITRAAAAQAARSAAASKLRYTLVYDDVRQQVVFTLIACSNLPLVTTLEEQHAAAGNACNPAENDSRKKSSFEPSAYAKIKLLPEHASPSPASSSAASPKPQHHHHYRFPHLGSGGTSPSSGRRGSFSHILSHTPLLGIFGDEHKTITVKHSANPKFNETIRLPHGLSPAILERQGRYLHVQIKHRESSWATEKKWLIGEARVTITAQTVSTEEVEVREIELVLV